eukprot:6193392-Pleurochrysis_carterae.AAC.3
MPIPRPAHKVAATLLECLSHGRLAESPLLYVSHTYAYLLSYDSSSLNSCRAGLQPPRLRCFSAHTPVSLEPASD